MTFDPVRTCQVLSEEAVGYVIIGGLAAALRGSPLPTEDVDVLPARDAENLDRLARALNRLNARIRNDRKSVQGRIDGPFLASMPHMLNLMINAGILDIACTPARLQAPSRILAHRTRRQLTSPSQTDSSCAWPASTTSLHPSALRIAQGTYAACPTWSPCAMRIRPRSRVRESGP